MAIVAAFTRDPRFVGCDSDDEDDWASPPSTSPGDDDDYGGAASSGGSFSSSNSSGSSSWRPPLLHWGSALWGGRRRQRLVGFARAAGDYSLVRLLIGVRFLLGCRMKPQVGPKPLGAAAARTHPKPPARIAQPPPRAPATRPNEAPQTTPCQVATVSEVAVHPDLRGLGIGGKLLKRIVNQARAARQPTLGLGGPTRPGAAFPHALSRLQNTHLETTTTPHHRHHHPAPKLQVCASDVGDIGLVAPAELRPFFQGCSFDLDREASVPMVLRGLEGAEAERVAANERLREMLRHAELP